MPLEQLVPFSNTLQATTGKTALCCVAGNHEYIETCVEAEVLNMLLLENYSFTTQPLCYCGVLAVVLAAAVARATDTVPLPVAIPKEE